jgi:hypothetical protein
VCFQICGSGAHQLHSVAVEPPKTEGLSTEGWAVLSTHPCTIPQCSFMGSGSTCASGSSVTASASSVGCSGNLARGGPTERLHGRGLAVGMLVVMPAVARRHARLLLLTAGGRDGGPVFSVASLSMGFSFELCAGLSIATAPITGAKRLC